MSYSAKVPVSKLGQFEKELAGNFKKVAKAAFDASRHQMVNVLKFRTINAMPAWPSSQRGAVAFGKLRDGWNVDHAIQNKAVKGRALATLEVWNAWDYARYVELGLLNGQFKISKDPNDASFQNFLAWVNKRIGIANSLTPAQKRMSLPRRKQSLYRSYTDAEKTARYIIGSMYRRQRRRATYVLYPRNILAGAKPKLNEIAQRFMQIHLQRAAILAAKKASK
jgi:hypothetical protein